MLLRINKSSIETIKVLFEQMNLPIARIYGLLKLLDRTDLGNVSIMLTKNSI